MPGAKHVVAKRRPRDATATRLAILKAAQALFTKNGYDRCALRQVAARAGVDVALVKRYFGSKQGLFAAIITTEAFTFEPFMVLGKAGFAEGLARHVVTKVKDRNKFDPLMIMLRSASSIDARDLLNQALEARLTVPLAKWLGGPNADLRANLIIAWLAGFDLMRNVIHSKSLSDAESEELTRGLSDAIQTAIL
jgi:AcrR family transcriptional regulator